MLRRAAAALFATGVLAGCSGAPPGPCDDPVRSLDEVLQVTGNTGVERRPVDGAYCATVRTSAGDVEACKMPTPLSAERYAIDHDAVVEWLTISMRGSAQARAEIVELVDDAREQCV